MNVTIGSLKVPLGQLFFLVVEAPLAAVISLYLLIKYGARHGAVPVAVWLIVGLVWFTSLLVPVLLPLDVAEGLAARCPVIYGKHHGCADQRANPEFIKAVWHFCYWFCFSMSWLVLPIVSSYILAGAFSWKKRFLFALRNRLLFFAIIGTLLGLATVLLIIRFQFSLLGLSGILVSLANGFGVIVATLMLSYGLIEVPKWLWNFGNYRKKIHSSELRATLTMERVDEAKASLARVLGEINASMALYENSKREMPPRRRRTVKKQIRIIQSEVPSSDPRMTLPNAINDGSRPTALTEDFLAGLRYKVKKRVIEFRKVAYLWRKRCVEAFNLQDLVLWSEGELRSESFAMSGYFRIRWYIVPIVSRLAAILTAILTAAIIWSEATVWTLTLPDELDLSPFSYVVHRLEPPYLVVQAICFLTVSYLFFCLFFGIFRFKLFMLYELVPRHTDPFTLVLNSTLCSRLLIPLAYNFITIMHETKYSVDILYPSKKDIPVSQIANLHRGMEEVPFFGVAFNMYFPAIMVLFVLLTLCKVWDRIMDLFDLTKYSFEGVDDERLESYGRTLLSQERERWIQAGRDEEGAISNNYVQTSATDEQDPERQGSFNYENGSDGSISEAEDADEVHQFYPEPKKSELEAFGGPIQDSVDVTEGSNRGRKIAKALKSSKASKGATSQPNSREANGATGRKGRPKSGGRSRKGEPEVDEYEF